MKIPRVPVVVLKLGETVRDTAMVIPETTVTIRLNQRDVTKLICRPENPEEVCIGFLLHQHVLKSTEEIKSIQVHPQTRVVSIIAQIETERIDELTRDLSSNGSILLRYSPSSERRSGMEDPSRTKKHPATRKHPATWSRYLTDSWDDDRNIQDENIQAENIQDENIQRDKRNSRIKDSRNKAFQLLSQMANKFHEACEVKGIFGAYHVAAFADPGGKIVCQSADVGMDITVDRILGKAFLSHRRWQDCTLMISERLRANTVIKTANLGIRSILTLSVVTHLALETALDFDIDIIHAKKDGSLTVYSRSAANTHQAPCVGQPSQESSDQE